MKLKKIDLINTNTLVAAGLLQLPGTFVFFNTPEEPAFWFFNGGVTLILAGFLNILRIKYSAKIPLIEQFSFLSNAILLVFWLVMAYFLFYKFVRYPFALLPLLLLLLAFIFSARDWLKRLRSNAP